MAVKPQKIFRLTLDDCLSKGTDLSDKWVYLIIYFPHSNPGKEYELLCNNNQEYLKLEKDDNILVFHTPTLSTQGTVVAVSQNIDDIQLELDLVIERRAEFNERFQRALYVYANRRAKALLENDEVDSVGTKNGHLKNEPQTKGDAKVRNNSLVQMTPSDWYSVKQVNKYMKDIRHCKEFTRAVYKILKNEQEVGKTLDGNKNTLLERYRKYLSERQMICAPNNDEENGLERASTASHSCTKKNMSSEGQSIENKENEGNCKCPICQMKERHSAQGSKDNQMDEATPGCSKYKDYDFGYSLPSTQKTNMKKELPVSSEGKENEDNCNCCNRENKLDYTASPFPNKNKIKSFKRILVDNTEENMENKNSMKDESCQDLESSTCSSSTSKAKRARQQLFSDDEDENMEEIDGQVKIGPGGTTVPKKIFKKIEWSKHTTATRKLLMEIFPRSVLSTHSLTGKPSPAFLNSGKDAKMRLDPIKTADIVECVSRRCKVTPSIVRNAITTKCADENKLYRKQLEKNKAAKRDDAYKVKPEGIVFNQV